GRLQLAAQRVEFGPQAGTRQMRVAFWPELLDQRFPGMRAIAVIRQVGEEGAGPLGAEAGDDPIPLGRPQPAKQLDLPGLIHTKVPPARVRSYSIRSGRALAFPAADTPVCNDCVMVDPYSHPQVILETVRSR